MAKQFEGTYVKKGPWTAEEDEVLMNHVKKYGPRDWSSIRSKGLLPRTGKSCRLRWVNKLRPNLKSGCKFTAEEERLVIELQAQFGNKWAKIATYLPGRTDNDVKNFWSSRRKRLERVLQRQKSPSKTSSHKSKGKFPLVDQFHPMEVLPCSSKSQEEPSCCRNQSYQPSYLRSSEQFQMIQLPDLVKPTFLNLETGIAAHEATPFLHMMPPPLESSSQYAFPEVPQPEQDLPLLPECFDIPPKPFNSDYHYMFEQQQLSTPQSGQNFGKKKEVKNPTSPEAFFEDLPADMIHYFEHLPCSSDH